MNWNHFIEDYNELTALSFDYLYHFSKEDEDLEIFKFNSELKTSWIRYYYTYDIDYNEINFQIDVKSPGKHIDTINIFYTGGNNIQHILRENEYFSRKTLSNINIHKTIFLWIYFLMLINGFNHKFVRL